VLLVDDPLLVDDALGDVSVGVDADSADF